MRSGMRSWSKWVIFSRRMKSSSRDGPRRPAISEFWLSATGTPWWVVSTCLDPSMRACAICPSMACATGTAGSPVLALTLTSLSVLADTGSGAESDTRPVGGFSALSRPKSCTLSALCGT
jgi:hypothetical protein